MKSRDPESGTTSNREQSRQADPAHTADPLENRLRGWLRKQGYPLEFAAAAALERAGFSARRGWHVDGTDEGARRREIDVIAIARKSDAGLTAGVDLVVECKWSNDKPWLAFLQDGEHDSHGKPDRSAPFCLGTALGNGTARMILQEEATLPGLSGLGTFSLRSAPLAFGGKQAFADNKDPFYEAISSVLSKAAAVAAQFNTVSDDLLLRSAFVVFPVIVIKGQLFTVRPQAGFDDLILEPAPHVRVLWQGSKEWPAAVVDIVTIDCLEAFATDRLADSNVLLDVMLQRLADYPTIAEAKSGER